MSLYGMVRHGQKKEERRRLWRVRLLSSTSDDGGPHPPTILGHGFRGADRSYLDPFQALRAALPTLEVPGPMKTGDTPILETLRTIDPDERLKILRAAAADLTADLGAAT